MNGNCILNKEQQQRSCLHLQNLGPLVFSSILFASGTTVACKTFKWTDALETIETSILSANHICKILQWVSSLDKFAIKTWVEALWIVEFSTLSSATFSVIISFVTIWVNHSSQLWYLKLALSRIGSFLKTWAAEY